MADNTPITDGAVAPSPLDSMICMYNGKINGLYYYYLEKNLYGGRAENTTVLGTTDAIVNIAYAPFLNLTSNNLRKVPYDTDRFGNIQSQSSAPTVYRVIFNDEAKPMTLIETTTYPDIPRPTKGTQRHWKYESKLYDFPYRSIIFSSNVFDKYEVIPHIAEESWLPDSVAGYIQLKACCPIAPGGNFYVEVDGYKCQKGGAGFLERYFVPNSMDMPNTSSAYSNYMSTQKSRTASREDVTLAKATFGAIPSALAGATAGASFGSALGPYGALGGAVIGGVLAGTTGLVNHQATVETNLATKKDMITTPNALKSMGGDVAVRLGEEQEAIVSVGDMTISEEYKQRLGDYFAMYGYKQNKVMPINIRSRWYYNYIKTVGCNLQAKSNTSVPKKHMASIKAIFDNGATLWHLDRNGGKYCDYSLDNTEV